MEATIEQTTQRPRWRRGRTALWLGLFVVLAIVGGRWVWRQVQFTRLRVPLIQAVGAGNTERVRELLEQGADPDAGFDYPSEPLSWATVLSRLRGRKPVTSSAGTTVLMDASRSGEVEIVRLLLDHGADTNKRHISKYDTDKQWAALHYAARTGSAKIVELLLNHGASVNARTAAQDTPLSLVIGADAYVHTNQIDSVPPPTEACVALLLEHGADVNTLDYRGVTVLMKAVMAGHPAIVTSLLARGADVKAQYFGMTPLLFAAIERDPIAVRTLLMAGAQIDTQDRWGRTALWAAVIGSEWDGGERLHNDSVERKRSLEVIRLLLARGADARIKERKGISPLKLAESNHDKEVVALLRKANAVRRALWAESS